MNNFVIPGLDAVLDGTMVKPTVGVADAAVQEKLLTELRTQGLPVLPDSVTEFPEMAKNAGVITTGNVVDVDDAVVVVVAAVVAVVVAVVAVVVADVAVVVADVAVVVADVAVVVADVAVVVADVAVVVADVAVVVADVAVVVAPPSVVVVADPIVSTPAVTAAAKV